MKEYKIYSLTDPRDGVVRYIGCTSLTLEKRLIAHIAESKIRQGLKDIWIQWLQSVGLKPIVNLIEVVSENDDPDERERFYIALHREKTMLFNMNSGGKSGYKHNPESIARLIKANTGLKRSPEIIAKMKTRIISQETRKKISEFMTGRYSGGKHPQAKQTRCVETGMTFPSSIDASRYHGLSRTAVTMAIKHNKKCAGYTWKYINDSTAMEN